MGEYEKSILGRKIDWGTSRFSRLWISRVFLPISFLVSLFLTFWGPNGRLFGNIGNSYWGYTPIKNINQAIKNMMILGLVDFSSTLVSAFILWYFCRINLWKAFNELQREFFKTFSIVLGIYIYIYIIGKWWTFLIIL